MFYFMRSLPGNKPPNFLRKNSLTLAPSIATATCNSYPALRKGTGSFQELFRAIDRLAPSATQNVEDPFFKRYLGRSMLDADSYSRLTLKLNQRIESCTFKDIKTAGLFLDDLAIDLRDRSPPQTPATTDTKRSKSKGVNTSTSTSASTSTPTCTFEGCNSTEHTIRDCPYRLALFCTNCERNGHIAKDCRSPNIKDVICKKCNQPGHYANRCPTILSTSKDTSKDTPSGTLRSR